MAWLEAATSWLNPSGSCVEFGIAGCAVDVWSVSLDRASRSSEISLADRVSFVVPGAVPNPGMVHALCESHCDATFPYCPRRAKTSWAILLRVFVTSDCSTSVGDESVCVSSSLCASWVSLYGGSAASSESASASESIDSVCLDAAVILFSASAWDDSGSKATSVTT